MASVHAEVVDLATSDDATSPSPRSTSLSTLRRKKNRPLYPTRRSPRTLYRGKNNNDRTSRTDDNEGVEVIELDSDSPVVAGRKRPQRSVDSEVEVLDVSVAGIHRSFGSRRSRVARVSLSADADPSNASNAYNDEHKETCIERIREVFPMVPREKARRLWDMATTYSSYSSGDRSDAPIQISLSVLADDPTGSSISESVVAAAAVRNNSYNSSILAPNGTTSTSEPTNNGKAGGLKVAMLECQCCFVEYSFEDMVSCRDQGHLFCKSCLQRHTEQRIFGIGNFGKSKVSEERNNSNPTSNNVATPPNAHEILCIHSSGCSSGFPESQLRRALDAKLMKKYDELQYMAVIEKASSTDASKFPKCPKCHYIAFAEESIELLPLFHCPQCHFKSCRRCSEEYHPNITCEEVETKQETSGRTSVEEAMTMAKVRTCPRPHCRKKFLKLDGCNKMSCACGALICYVCRKEIPKGVGYKHFCQTPHCQHESCNKCPLYSTEKRVEEEDKRKVKEAAMRAVREVEEKTGGSGGNKTNGGAGNERKQQVRIDVESLLKDPPAQWGRNRKRK